MDYKELPNKDTVIITTAKEIADLWVEYQKGEKKLYGGSHPEVFKAGDFYGSINETEDTLIKNEFKLEDFFENKWSGKLRQDLSFLNFKSKKRKRKLSEHDGDLDMDRAFDIQYFNSTRTEPFDNRIMVDISFDISCWFTAKDIREYGKLCFHVINFIEEHGYVCDVNIVSETKDMYYIKSHGNQNLTKINIKRSDEYQDNIVMCKYFTDWFYRRCMFNMWYHFGVEKKLKVAYGLGCPKQNLQTFGEPGYVYLTPELKSQMEGKMDFAAITKAVETALGGKQ